MAGGACTSHPRALGAGFFVDMLAGVSPILMRCTTFVGFRFSPLGYVLGFLFVGKFLLFLHPPSLPSSFVTGLVSSLLPGVVEGVRNRSQQF